MGFGRGPLSHPLVVELFEDAFVPVLVHNNRDGLDRRWREHFHEPAWNNPVVRFLGRDGDDILPRKDRVWKTAALLERTFDVLGHGKQPAWWSAVLWEADDERHARAAFATHCFWEGEAKIGALTGVVRVEARHWQGQEIVEVRYHEGVLDWTKLVREAVKLDCAAKVLATTDEQLRAARDVAGERALLWDGRSEPAAASDRTHDLAASPLRLVPTTPVQAMKLNSALASGNSTVAWLSPRQRTLADSITRKLTREPRALEGLVRPDSIDALWAYTAELRARLQDAR